MLKALVQIWVDYSDRPAGISLHLDQEARRSYLAQRRNGEVELPGGIYADDEPPYWVDISDALQADLAAAEGSRYYEREVDYPGGVWPVPAAPPAQ